MTTRLDIGCGKNKRQVVPGEPDQTPWIGVDSIKFEGVDVGLNVVARSEYYMTVRGKQVRPGEFIEWPWDDSSVDEVFSSHFIEHLTPIERCWFFNELHRVLKPNAKAVIITPHWASNRAYGDPTHQWPPVSEMMFYYLRREWRMGDEAKKIPANAPHTDKQYWPHGYDCDFEAVWGYNFHPHFATKHQDVRENAQQWYKEAIFDTIAHLTCLKPQPTQIAPAPQSEGSGGSQSFIDSTISSLSTIGV